jgi:branched-chain amino acid aminotransferase
MPFDTTKWIWMNGRLVNWNEATFHVSAHALHYGSGVFEGIRSYETEEGAAIFRLDAHLTRLFYSASQYELPIPFSPEELREAVCETIRENGFTSCYVRPICFYGSDSLGVHPRNCPVEVAILAWQWGAYLGAEGLEKGIRVTASPWQKFSSQMMPTTAKACGGYINSTLAVRDAFQRGFDEALLFDSRGYIAEGSGENIFLVRKGRLVTNNEQSSILLGITRDAVMRLARDLGYDVEVGKFRLEDLLSADEAFFTGTAAEVTPIREVDGEQIGEGRRGEVTTRIQKAFFDAAFGRDPRYRDWLHFLGRQVPQNEVPEPVYVSA